MFKAPTSESIKTLCTSRRFVESSSKEASVKGPVTNVCPQQSRLISVIEVMAGTLLACFINTTLLLLSGLDWPDVGAG